MSIWLSVNDVQRICFELVSALKLDHEEPLPPFETRYPGRLEACLGNPQQTFDRQPLYPTLVDQAAILFYSLSKAHAFQNGNKRIALTALLAFLYINEKWLFVGLEELHDFAVMVAASEPTMKDDVVNKIKTFIIENIMDRDAIFPR